MPIRYVLLLAVLLAGGLSPVQAGCTDTLDFHLRPLAGETPVHLCEAYAGQVVLIVNTASKCAYTPQYEGLEKLYAEYKDRGLAVLGFPSNDFGNQEPGDEAAIQGFCRMTYVCGSPCSRRPMPPSATPTRSTACSASGPGSTRAGTSTSTCWIVRAA